jgi:uncharacterized membrane protein YidH (DUF202 family)
MTWLRTSLAVIGLGFAMNEFFRSYQQGLPGIPMAHPEDAGILGLVLIVSGTLGTLFGATQYWAAMRHLRSAEFEPNGRRPGLPSREFFSLAVAGFCALIGLVTTVWIAAR